MNTRRAAAAFAVLALSASGVLPAAAQSAPPLPQPTPIAVPTMAPHNSTTDAIVRAAIGLVGDELAREHARIANNSSGVVTYFKHYDLQVQTGPNSYRNVHLHPGTVIYPRGATPGNGSSVDISGRAQPDGTLEADSITVRQ